MRNIILLFIFISTLSSCSSSGRKAAYTSYTLADSAMMFWDDYSFVDSANNTKEMNKRFFRFILLLEKCDSATCDKAVKVIMDKISKQSPSLLNNINDMANKFLYNPNSPYRNENKYLPFVKYIVQSSVASSSLKSNSEYILKMMKKNRPGLRAIDFTYILKDESKSRMYDIKSNYLIIFFNNPGCNECKRMIELLRSVFPVNNDNLKILSVYSDSDIKLWENEVYPDGWINARCSSDVSDNEYCLQAIPTLYLLDSEKRVILKDAQLDEVIQYLLHQLLI